MNLVSPTIRQYQDDNVLMNPAEYKHTDQQS